MRWLVGIGVLTIAMSFASFGQNTLATPWTGTWKLNLDESKFGIILVPGIPADFKLLSQTLTVEPAANGVRLVGDSTVSVGGKSQTGHDDNILKFDGTPTNVGDLSLTLHQVGHSAFEIISTIDTPNTNVDEVSQYQFLPDGKKLTVTKIQTERTPLPAGSDKRTGAILRRSKFVLVYDRLPERE